MSPQPATEFSQRIMGRYTDAYRVTGAVVLLGTAVKTVGILLAVALLMLYLAVFTKGNLGLRPLGSFSGQSVVVAAFVLIGLIFLVFWVVGVLVSAQGQLMKASVDPKNGS